MSQHPETCDWEIRRERAEDGPCIAALTEAGFGPGRYAKSAYRLREGVDAVADLGFVAVESGDSARFGAFLADQGGQRMMSCFWGPWRWKAPSAAAASASR